MSLESDKTASTLNWLLETSNPGVRYLALRDLLALEKDNPELAKARNIAHQRRTDRNRIRCNEPGRILGRTRTQDTTPNTAAPFGPSSF